jgi:hypothetical protein
MRLLYIIIGLHLTFGTRLGCALFALIGGATVIAILAHGKPTATSFLFLVLTGIAVKRAINAK